MLNFKPIGSYRDVEKVYLDTLNGRYHPIVSRNDVIDALKAAGRRLKELTQQTRLENRGYLLQVFDHVRANMDCMVDAVQLDEKGSIVRVWNPKQWVPRYTDFVSGIIQDHRLSFVFHPEDDQLFFADRDMETVRAVTGFDSVDVYGRLPNTEPVYTFFTKPETVARLNGDVAVATVVFMESENERQPIAVVRDPALLISNWQEGFELKSLPIDPKAQKIAIPDDQPEFVTGAFAAYIERSSSQSTPKPLVICYRRIDRCDFE